MSRGYIVKANESEQPKTTKHYFLAQVWNDIDQWLPYSDATTPLPFIVNFEALCIRPSAALLQSVLHDIKSVLTALSPANYVAPSLIRLSIYGQLFLLLLNSAPQYTPSLTLTFI